VIHERHIERIQELVDGTLGPIRRSELEQHLAECEDCRALKEDLERIRDAAAALPALPPPDGAWLQIAGRLRQEGRVRPAPVVETSRGFSYGWLAIAATLVLVAGVSVLMLLRFNGNSSAPAPAAAPTATAAPGDAGTASVEAAQNAVEAAQRQYEQAIENLQSVAQAHMDSLDPQTSTVIEKNLNIIDRAIAENRVAVQTEPTSVAARETLFEALRQKVSLLQDTIALINEMRKGNNAAAAQLVNKAS
jgi:anti-sigma factor RsiW